MNILNIILIFIWAIVIPLFTGWTLGTGLVVHSADPGTDPSGTDAYGLKNKNSISKSLMFGFVLYLAVFFLTAFPMIRLGLPFIYVRVTWTVLILAVFIFSIWRFVKEKKYEDILRGGGFFAREPLKGYAYVIWGAAVFIILSQTLLLTFRMHMDTDDARFIAEAVETYSKGTMLSYNPITGDFTGGAIGEMLKDRSSPYPIFIALLSHLFKLHPAITAHTVLPLLFIPLSYLVAYNVFLLFFEKDTVSIGLAVLFLSLIYFFYFGNKSSVGYVLLEIIWQGRSVGALIMLQIVWYILLRFILDEKLTLMHHILLVMSGLSSICLSGTMAIIFSFFVAAHMPAILYKKRSVYPVLSAFLSILPCAIGLYLYYTGR
ncbi:MAG: hypothetical protein K6G22_04955 [Lachnospiraceae bacterium]|nr:hypothetical protein [Lachnospiraceae bacterium]